jgi:hypothetical protein
MGMSISLGLSLSGSGGGGAFSPEASALFAAMTTPPTAARKTLIDACIVSLKAAGVWSKLDAFYMTAAADSQAARLNWKTPGSQTLSAVNSPTFTADRGYQGDGISAHLTAAVDLTVGTWNATRNSCHMATLSGQGGYSTGARYNAFLGGSLDTYFASPTSAGYQAFGGNFSRAVASVYNKIIASDRAISTTVVPYFDGAALSSLGDTSIAPTSAGLTVLRLNTTYSAAQLKFICFGASLSAAEHAALNSAVTTYLTALGAI